MSYDWVGFTSDWMKIKTEPIFFKQIGKPVVGQIVREKLFKVQGKTGQFVLSHRKLTFLETLGKTDMIILLV